ncbi:MAG: HIT domain-containing protein [Acidimicrobiales bacterium]
MVDQLWAAWRVAEMNADRAAGSEMLGGRVPADRSLFEAILGCGEPDSSTHILWRGERVYALLNRYPYTNGHLMVVPKRAVADLEGLEPSEFAELWDGVRRAITAIKRGLHPDGVNMGANLGEGAGPSVPDHVHVHVVPRWRSDTNFMSAVADVRVLPQGLSETWELLREAWPDD